MSSTENRIMFSEAEVASTFSVVGLDVFHHISFTIWDVTQKIQENAYPNCVRAKKKSVESS